MLIPKYSAVLEVNNKYSFLVKDNTITIIITTITGIEIITITNTRLIIMLVVIKPLTSECVRTCVESIPTIVPQVAVKPNSQMKTSPLTIPRTSSPPQNFTTPQTSRCQNFTKSVPMKS